MLYSKFIKLLLDILIAFLILLLLSPILVLVMLLLFINNKGSIFFFQQRPGKKSNIFKVIKFKTMNDKRDISGNLLSDSDRNTKIRNLVRSTSLGELPQLINVFKGDMSLIGPRSLLLKYLPLYSKGQSIICEVRLCLNNWG